MYENIRAIIIKFTRPTFILIPAIAALLVFAGFEYLPQIHIYGKKIVFSCDGLNNSDKQKCWEDELDSILEKENLDAAFQWMAERFDKDEAFGSLCHDFAHRLGEEAYNKYAEGAQIEMTAKAAYCAYGFYHGFVEALVQGTGDPAGARDFCIKTGDRLNGEAPFTRGHCFHGIGHGVMDGSDPRVRGDALAMIKKPLELCHVIGQENIDLESCASGVFNSLAILFFNPEMNLDLRRDDPYWVCRNQEEYAVRKPCYEEMNTLVLRIADYDIAAAAKISSRLKEEPYAQFAMKAVIGFGAFFVIHNNLSYDSIVATCHSLQPHLQTSCLQGFIGGLWEHGQPKQEHLEIIKFCMTGSLSDDEQGVCFEDFSRWLSVQRSPGQVEEICRMVEPQFRRYCGS